MFFLRYISGPFIALVFSCWNFFGLIFTTYFYNIFFYDFMQNRFEEKLLGVVAENRPRSSNLIIYFYLRESKTRHED